MTPREIQLPVRLTPQERAARWRKAFVESFKVPASTLDLLRRSAIASTVITMLASCESARAIPTAAHPHGELVPCVGLQGNGKRTGIDYEISTRNLFWGIVGVEFIYPPLKVAIDETFCPAADTTSATSRRRMP